MLLLSDSSRASCLVTHIFKILVQLTGLIFFSGVVFQIFQRCVEVLIVVVVIFLFVMIFLLAARTIIILSVAVGAHVVFFFGLGGNFFDLFLSVFVLMMCRFEAQCFGLFNRSRNAGAARLLLP